MIKEAYVSYEIAKLLKEKGFAEPLVNYYYTIKGKRVSYLMSEEQYLCPTLQMACAWLIEKHNILISIIPQEVKVGVDKLCYAIYRITEDVYTPLYNGYINNLVDSYEDTVEAAIKYCLENLI